MVYGSITGEAQKCFETVEGFMVCNFVVRKGREIRSRSGKWLRFKMLRRAKKKNLLATEGNSSKQIA